MRRTPDHFVRWSKREKSLLYRFERCKSTSMLLAHFFEGILDSNGHTLARELERRGYDLTTFRFTISKKPA